MRLDELKAIKPYQDLIDRCGQDNEDYKKSMEKYQQLWVYYAAIQHEDKETIAQLMSELEDVNDICVGGALPPLFTACMKKDVDLAKFLVEKGCDVNGFVANYGSVLDYSILWGEQEFTDYLVCQKALTKADMITANRSIIKALEHNDIAFADSLVDEKYQGKFNFVLKHSLMNYAVRNNNPDIVKYLFSKGANMNYDLETRRNCTWLHRTAYLGADKVVPLLIEAGFNLEEKTDKKQTPLWTAVQGGDIKTVQTLLDLGANVHTQDFNGASLLHLASRFKNEKMVEFFLDKGVDLSLQDVSLKTAYEYALEQGDEKKINVFKKYLKKKFPRKRKVTSNKKIKNIKQSSKQNEG